MTKEVMDYSELRSILEQLLEKVSVGMPHLLTKRNAARELDCSRGYLEKLIRTGQILTTSLDASRKGIRIPRSEVLRIGLPVAPKRRPASKLRRRQARVILTPSQEAASLRERLRKD